MSVLVVKTGPLKGKEFPVDGDSVQIGREESAGICVPDHGISRRHCEIFRIGEMVFVRDMDSRNGTFVNEEKIKEELLRDGDKIRVGTTEMVYENRGFTGSADQAGGEAAGAIPQPGLVSGESTIAFNLGSDDDAEDIAAVKTAHESRDLDALYQVAQAVGAERNLDVMLPKVCKIACEAVGGDQAHVLLKHPERNEIKLAARYMKPGQKETKVSRAIVRKVLHDAKGVITTDASLDDRFADSQTVIMRQIKGVVAVPLVAREEVGGVLYIAGGKVGGSFDEKDLELATAVGVQLGMAYQSAWYAHRAEEALTRALRTLVVAIEARDPRARGKAARQAALASALGTAAGLSREENRNLQLGALLSRIGTLGMSDEDRMGSPADQATREARAAEKLLAEVPGMEDVARGVKHHAERHDGQGYPDGLQGDDVPMAARLIATAGRLDDLLSGRSGGQELSVKDALLKLHDDGDTLLHPAAVTAAERAQNMGILFNPPELLKGL